MGRSGPVGDLGYVLYKNSRPNVRIPSFGHMTQWDTPGMHPFLEKIVTLSRCNLYFLVSKVNFFTCIMSLYICNIMCLYISASRDL